MIHLRPLRQENGEENAEEAVGGNEVGEEPSGEAAQEEEEAVRGTKDPAEPSCDERARRELTHVPFRPWRHHCVSGKAADDPHQRRHEWREEPEVAKASIDYVRVCQARRRGDDPHHPGLQGDAGWDGGRPVRDGQGARGPERGILGCGAAAQAWRGQAHAASGRRARHTSYGEGRDWGGVRIQCIGSGRGAFSGS